MLLRVLKLYVVVNDKNIYELNEQQPLIIENEKLPMNITAKNGFHFSNPLTIKQTTTAITFVGIGCKADNGRFWGSILLSTWLFILFFATQLYLILFFANLPLLFLIIPFFWKPKDFITLKIITPN